MMMTITTTIMICRMLYVFITFHNLERFTNSLDNMTLWSFNMGAGTHAMMF